MQPGPIMIYPNTDMPALCCVKIYNAEAAIRPQGAPDVLYLVCKHQKVTQKGTVIYMNECAPLLHFAISVMQACGQRNQYAWNGVHQTCSCLLLILTLVFLAKLIALESWTWLRLLKLECRYQKSPMGQHKISELMPDLCQDANIERRTNHGMRRSSITNMYRQRLPEHEIQRRSRHKSLETLRKYCTCDPASYACSLCILLLLTE